MTEPRTTDHAAVQGRCPACGGSSLTIGRRGYVICGRDGCPDPTAVDKLLHGERVTAVTPLVCSDERHAAKVTSLEAERDGAYRERAHLVALLAAMTDGAVITPALDLDESGWWIAYLTIGKWQASWHISPRDAGLFRGVERVEPDDPRAQWDGHTTDQKYTRIRNHTRVLEMNRRLAAGRVQPQAATDATDPHTGAVVQPYRDHGQEKWVFRCWGTDTCDGMVSLDHTSRQWAEQARARHLAEDHKVISPAATEATEPEEQK